MLLPFDKDHFDQCNLITAKLYRGTVDSATLDFHIVSIAESDWPCQMSSRQREFELRVQDRELSAHHSSDLSSESKGSELASDVDAVLIEVADVELHARVVLGRDQLVGPCAASTDIANIRKLTASEQDAAWLLIERPLCHTIQ